MSHMSVTHPRQPMGKNGCKGSWCTKIGRAGATLRFARNTQVSRSAAVGKAGSKQCKSGDVQYKTTYNNSKPRWATAGLAMGPRAWVGAVWVSRPAVGHQVQRLGSPARACRSGQGTTIKQWCGRSQAVPPAGRQGARRMGTWQLHGRGAQGTARVSRQVGCDMPMLLRRHHAVL